MKEFPCKYCGISLHYDNETGKVADSSNAYHNCPLAPWNKNKKINEPRPEIITVESTLTELAKSFITEVNKQLRNFQLELTIKERD